MTVNTFRTRYYALDGVREMIWAMRSKSLSRCSTVSPASSAVAAMIRSGTEFVAVGHALSMHLISGARARASAELGSISFRSCRDGERFGFFLPQLDVPRGQSAEFHTVGLYYHFSGPDSIPHRDPSWRCIELLGTAQTVIVQL